MCATLRETTVLDFPMHVDGLEVRMCASQGGEATKMQDSKEKSCPTTIDVPSANAIGMGNGWVDGTFRVGW